MQLLKTGGFLFCILLYYGALLLPHSAKAQSTLVLDSVSVTSDSRYVVLGWTLTPPVTEGSIEIHRQLPNGLYARITSLPLNQTSFTDTGANPNQESWSYYIVARDLNGDNIAVSHEAHRTIFQHPPTFSVCQRLIHVAWDGYRVTTSAGEPTLLPTPFSHFRVVVWNNDTIFTALNPISGIVGNFDIRVQHPGTYQIKIIYTNPLTGITSSSNVRGIDVALQPQHSFLHIRGVSLDAPSVNSNIRIAADSSIQGAGYILLRQDMQTGQFVALDTIYLQVETIMFADQTSQGNVRSEIYKVQAIDQCGEISIESQPIGTIFLQVENITGTTFELTWNNYQGWAAGIEEYQVLRSSAGSGYEIIDALPGNANSFTDNIAMNDPGQFSGIVSYRIRAIEEAGNQFGFRDTVLSNIATINIDHDIFIPNAINVSSPVAQNRIFRPVFSYFSPQDYSLSIFNRWGQPVFRTSDPTQGWDGIVSGGGNAPAGVYSYVIEFKNPDSSMRKISGVFMLLR